MREVIEQLVAGRDLDVAAMEAAMEAVLTGKATPAQIAAFLVALRIKGERASEVAAAARVMRRHAVAVHTRGAGPLLDTCGTGGDGSGSFNVSTAAAIVVAACGVRVAKHGNRAASSKAGSADVLEALGLQLDQPADAIGRCIDEVGIGFMFARAHHPAMRHAAPVRAELGLRTLFNLLGPLCNPAGATHQLLGVGDASKQALMAEVLLSLGTEGAWVVHGHGGLDEVSVSGPTRVLEVRQGALHERVVTPEEFGVERSAPGELAGGDAAFNASALRSVLEGASGAKRDAVVVNAGAALCVAGASASPREGAAQAARAIDSGAAREKLALWMAFCARVNQVNHVSEVNQVNQVSQVTEPTSYARPDGDVLQRIMYRKRFEVRRRERRAARYAAWQQALGPLPDLAPAAIASLRRAGATLPRVIAEIKLRSPSAGLIRPRVAGELARIATGYVQGGASAVSVLCDGPGFGGSVLDLRRVAQATDCPLLFKEFVLDPIQITLARLVGAHMVLLLVRALAPDELFRLVDAVHAAGLAPVVEVADDEELAVALRSDACIIGVNARDLRTFHVDPQGAQRIVEGIPSDRVAVLMSGIKSGEELAQLARSRADAVLVGEALMRAPEPGQALCQWLAPRSAG